MKKKKRIGPGSTGHSPVPFTRAHSPRVKRTTKQTRRETKKEQKEIE